MLAFLPFAVGGLLFFLNPSLMSVLFHRPAGPVYARYGLSEPRDRHSCHGGHHQEEPGLKHVRNRYPLQTLAGYLTIRLGQANLSPGGTVVLVLTLAAASCAAFHLWRIGRQEDRRDRLMELRGPWSTEPFASSARAGTSGSAASLLPAQLSVLPSNRDCSGFSLPPGSRGTAVFLALSRASSAAPSLSAALLGFCSSGEVVRRIDDDPRRRDARHVDARLAPPRFSSLASRGAATAHLERGLPDALDLLVICAEAGLSLDQSIEQVSQDLRGSNSAVADEFATTASEMRVLSNRADALENLVARTGVAGLRSITATLNQAIRFGTPLADRCGFWPPNAYRALPAHRGAGGPVTRSARHSAGSLYLTGTDDGDQLAGGASPFGHV